MRDQCSGILGILAALLSLFSTAWAAPVSPDRTRYLAFQIFTGGFDSAELRQSLPPPASLSEAVDDIRARVYVPGVPDRRLGFVIGPLSFDNSDDEVRSLIGTSFGIALRTGMAVGFHIDDSMFWGRLKNLNRHQDIEWLDWSGRPGTGRRLDWGIDPVKIMPQLCLNSPDVIGEVTKRATLIGDEIQRGRRQLHAAGKDDLFIGVIAGWETQVGKDFDTGKQLGYCALTNEGFNASRPPANFERARADIVRDFVALWARSIANAGIPKDKIYSHTAFLSESLYRLARRVNPGHTASSYLEAANATPPDIAFSRFNRPGFSTYPMPGVLEQIRDEVAKHDDMPWASSEGTAIDPSVADRGGLGMDMEAYLGNLFDHGAQFVNVFGWGVGDSNNAFRRVAEAPRSVIAYRKFLDGDALREEPIPAPQIPSVELPAKMRLIQQRLPRYVERNGPARVSSLAEQLGDQMSEHDFAKAETTADQILQIIAH